MKFLLALTALPLTSALLTDFIISGTKEEMKMHHLTWCCSDSQCIDACAMLGQEPGVEPPGGWVVQDPIVKAQDFRFYYPVLEDPSAATEDDPWFDYDQVFYNLPVEGCGLDGALKGGCGERFCETIFPWMCNCRKGCAAVKDPHFKRWNGEWYDFHGECDLVFLKAPQFAKGLGMDIHIRTKMRYGYSFIESAALKIGDDVLEVSSYSEYQLNGVDGADLKHAHIGPFKVEYEYINEKEQVFTIVTDSDQTVQIRTFKDFVDVKLNDVSPQDFKDAQGMMGAFPSGNMTARDGISIIEEPNQYGLEWQVRGDLDDPTLFTIQREPAYPSQCILPDMEARAERRRLEEGGVSSEDAEEACSHHADATHKDMCVFDVMATGDLELASAGAY